MNVVRPHDPRSRPARGTGDLLVTGATGFLGHAVARELDHRGLAARLLVRPSSRDRAPAGSRFWVREGDLLDATTLPGAVEGVRTVLHLAGLVGMPDPERNRRAHVDATRNLLLASRAAGVERLVVLSSDTVLRRQLSAYARSKVEMEALLRAEAGGIDVVVLRPAMILGPGSRHEASLLRLARLPMLPLPQGLPPRAPVRVDDVALAVLTAALLPRDALPPDPVALFGPVDLDWPALVAHVARSHGLPAPRVIPIPPRVPASFARLAVRAGFAALGERLLGLREGVPIDREPARTWLQFQPRPL